MSLNSFIKSIPQLTDTSGDLFKYTYYGFTHICNLPFFNSFYWLLIIWLKHDSIYLTPHSAHFLFHLIGRYNENNSDIQIIVQLNSGFNFSLIHFHSVVDIKDENIFESVATNISAHSDEYISLVTTLLTMQIIQFIIFNRVSDRPFTLPRCKGEFMYNK